MAFRVKIALSAERDLLEIFRYVAENDSVPRADRVLTALEQACGSLEAFPERGNIPKELRSLGIVEYREIHRKPYRIIYRVLEGEVIVYCVADGRRDMQALLERRLLR